MILKRRVPEILRIMMPAGEEADIGRFRIARKGQRECNLNRRAVGTFSFTRQFEQFEVADARGAKLLGIRNTAAFQRQHGEPLPARQEVAVERAERKAARCVRRRLRRVGESQDFDVAAGKLHDVVLRAPFRRMAVARADGEAKPPIEIGGRLEIAHGVNDMVEAARHRAFSGSPRTPSAAASRS